MANNTPMQVEDLMMWDIFHFVDENMLGRRCSHVKDPLLDSSNLLVLGTLESEDPDFVCIPIVVFPPGWDDEGGPWVYAGMLEVERKAPVLVANMKGRKQYIENAQTTIVARAVSEPESDRRDQALSIAVELLNFEVPSEDILKHFVENMEPEESFDDDENVVYRLASVDDIIHEIQRDILEELDRLQRKVDADEEADGEEDEDTYDK